MDKGTLAVNLKWGIGMRWFKVLLIFIVISISEVITLESLIFAEPDPVDISEMKENDKRFDAYSFDPKELDEIEKHTTICNGERKDLSCLKKNYKKLYMESSAHFWTILEMFSEATKSCKPLSKVTEYLSFAEVNDLGVAVLEGFSEDVSRFCRRQPDCFSKAVEPLGERTKLRLRRHVTHGLFWYTSGQTEEDADRCGLPRGEPDW